MAGFSQRCGSFIFIQIEKLLLSYKYTEVHELANFGFQVHGFKNMIYVTYRKRQENVKHYAHRALHIRSNVCFKGNQKLRYHVRFNIKSI